MPPPAYGQKSQTDGQTDRPTDCPRSRQLVRPTKGGAGCHAHGQAIPPRSKSLFGIRNELGLGVGLGLGLGVGLGHGGQPVPAGETCQTWRISSSHTHQPRPQSRDKAVTARVASRVLFFFFFVGPRSKRLVFLL